MVLLSRTTSVELKFNRNLLKLLWQANTRHLFIKFCFIFSLGDSDKPQEVKWTLTNYEIKLCRFGSEISETAKLLITFKRILIAYRTLTNRNFYVANHWTIQLCDKILFFACNCFSASHRVELDKKSFLRPLQCRLCSISLILCFKSL